uniref:Uncharacterized protein n=1 Tax=Ananas comosus var. bracteatus TaxID=296719 RepID=A0A6V7NRY6_ANACO|nr:unnamed protein product [Ananas comosus var. bracteatus]
MASSKALLGCFLLLILLFVISFAEPRPENTQMLMNEGSAIDCGGACAERCKESSRPNLCKRACGTCCRQCSCVPPGTYGNYEVCPCYAAITTRGGRKKCP